LKKGCEEGRSPSFRNFPLPFIRGRGIKGIGLHNIYNYNCSRQFERKIKFIYNSSRGSEICKRRLNPVKKNEVLVNCAKCTRQVCNSPAYEDGPDNCPMKVVPEIIKKAVKKYYASPGILEFARNASRQEGAAYMRLPHSPGGPSPIKSRVEEIMEFAGRMGYKRLGVGYCLGVQFEASLLVPILENRGFEVISVCCKCGAVSKEELGIEDWQKVNPGGFEAMCNPVAQAEILNSYKTDFNLLMCLCVGHDSLFLKYSDVLCTVLAAKDRLYGHNPLAALYQSKSYHRRVLAKSSKPDAARKAERDSRK
jgi:uncharacterized metal-binding protein